MRMYFFTSLLLIPAVLSFSVRHHQLQRPSISTTRLSAAAVAASGETVASLESLATNFENSLEACRADVTKTCKVAVGVSATTGRLGLIATGNIRKNELMVNVPYDERFELSPNVARDIIFKDFLADSYEGWTGDNGLIALQLLNEVARASPTTGAGVALPPRPEPMQAFIASWIQALPSPEKLDHPLLWPEEDQEVLQSSSNTKIYRALDDVEEDVTWLVENVFGKDRTTFPETVQWNGKEISCFTIDGYKWAMALTQSRSVFVDASLRILPLMDMCNHDDDADEISPGSMGTFGTTKGAQLLAYKAYKKGEEIFCSYGPKSSADYLLEHGFCPTQSWKTAVSEISLELSQENRFYNDKLDILEFETYDQAPLDPTQSFDVVSVPGRDGEPDPAMIQFARLCELGGADAFLLESIFRKEVWEFMELPVSERNELAVVESISAVLVKALEDLGQCPEGGPAVCTKLRESEIKALERTLKFLQREKEALDLKEYYQERRLKDLGLDSEWSKDDDMSPDLGFGQTRAPGGADYDW